MYFMIKEILESSSEKCINNKKDKYVAVLSSKEWKKQKEGFSFEIDIELETSEILSTTADVNYDCLTGTFCVPNREDLSKENKFAFALDENGIVSQIIKSIRKGKRWRFPSLERFLYDFLDNIIKNDFRIMESYERELGMMEYTIMKDEELDPNRVNDMRGDIRDLRNHYEQLFDLGQILRENENNFFDNQNIRYFTLFLNRVERLKDISASVRDYTIQVQDLYKSHLDIKQNHIITMLTVITSIFMPLNLITGWFGMNFNNMPGLKKGYPLVVVISIIIVIACLLFFKKKKWL